MATIDTNKSIVTYIYNLLTTDESLKSTMGGTVRLYLTWAVPNAEFPYLVQRLDIRPAGDFFPLRVGTLYLDLWSDSTNANEIMAIRKRIIELFDKKKFSNSEADSTRVSLDTEGFVPEPEEGIWHYATQWEIRYYRKAETASIIGR